jgi:hypothetical protein
VLAWPQDGEQVAYVNVHNTFVPKDRSTLRKDKDGNEILPWTGRACLSVAEATRVVEFAATSADARNIYFCTSTQAYAEDKVSLRGFKYKKAVRSQEHAVKMKSLFIDMDLVDGKKDKSKGYDTKEAMAAALVEFLKATGLPRPTIIVNTGGGWHIYWTLLRALTVEEWLPLAYALAEATRQHDLKCDTACTIDAARVLRVPGTKNFKYDPPRPVTILGNPIEFDYVNEKLEKALEPYKVQVPYSVASAAMSILPPRTPLTGQSDLSAGIDTSALAPINLDSLLFECGFLAEAVATGGAAFPNPLWNLTTLISTFTEGGRLDAHRMASGHTGYGPGETDELFDRKMGERQTRNLGWPRCSAISASGCRSCVTCPHFSENKSPLNFAPKPSNHVSLMGGFSAPTQAQFQQAAVSSPQSAASPAQSNAPQTVQGATLSPGTGVAAIDLPTGYLRNPNGVVLYPTSLDDGSTTWMPLSHYPMVDPWLQRNPWCLNFTTETEYGKTSQITIPLKDVGTSEMKKTMQDQGFMVTGSAKGFNSMVDFIMAWVTKLQATRDAVVSSVPFGWLVRHGKAEGFVFGGKLHTPKGMEVAANTDPELASQFQPTGDRLTWITAAQLITDQQRPALDAILASAFAGPLVRWTGHSGLLMSAYSTESGIGKSTALKVAQAVWGDPVKAVQSLSDTQNSVLNKLGELKSLPIYWDELKTEEDTKRFVDTVFRLTLGKEKSRMSSKVAQRTPGTWQTMMIAASNDSLLDSIAFKTRATTAGLYRVFEFTVAPAQKGGLGQIDPTVAQRVLSKLHDNYGTIGYDYASYLGSNHTQVEQDVATMLSNISYEVTMQPDERFWVALIATTLLGARYANALGYTNIDEVGLKTFMYATLKELRAERHRQPVDMKNVVNVVNTLARFLNESRARHTLVTDIIWKQRGKPPQNAVNIKGDSSRLDTIHVHIGALDRTLRIGQSYLSDWLALNNYPRHVFHRALVTELNAVALSGRLGAGTSYANATEYLFEIDLTGSPLINFLDEA